MRTPRFRMLSLPILGVSAIVVAYTIARAQHVLFTHDESFTYVYHVRASIVEIVMYAVGLAPSNNHLLNTLSMKLAAAGFGASELALRSPNLVAQWVYLLASFLILRRLGHPVVVVAGFIILNTNPLVLSYFALARGYGLSLAFILLSLHFCIRYQASLSVGDLFFAGFSGVLAVLSSIPSLHFFLALVITLLGIIAARALYLDRAGGDWRMRCSRIGSASRPLIVNALVLWALVSGPIWKLRQRGEFYYGGTRGFWADTVLSLVDASLGELQSRSFLVWSLQVLVLVIAGGSLFLLLARLARRRTETVLTSPSSLMTVLTLLTVASTMAQHYVMGIPYLIDRTAIVFLPLFSLMLITFLDEALVEGRYVSLRRLGAVCFIVLAVLSGWNMGNMVQSEGIAGTRLLEPPLRQVLDDLTVEVAATGAREVRLGTRSTYEPTLNHYRLVRDLTWLKAVDRTPLSESFDYYLYERSDLATLGRKELVTVHTYPYRHGELTLARSAHGALSGADMPPASAVGVTSAPSRTP